MAPKAIHSTGDASRSGVTAAPLASQPAARAPTSDDAPAAAQGPATRPQPTSNRSPQRTAPTPTPTGYVSCLAP
jgi:hypothetical protein